MQRFTKDQTLQAIDECADEWATRVGHDAWVIGRCALCQLVGFRGAATGDGCKPCAVAQVLGDPKPRNLIACHLLLDDPNEALLGLSILRTIVEKT